MTEDYILGNTDLASLALWIFFFFFVGLVIYLQRENQREGYPLVDDDGSQADAGGVFPVPDDKTFILPHGRGEKSVPSGQNPDRTDLPLARAFESGGFPWDPTGDALAAGVGPGSWCPRADEAEFDGHGSPKIVPMESEEEFHVSAGFDPRGLPVVSGDGKTVGMVTDMWIDKPEQLVRYLQIELDGTLGAGTRLVPMGFARIWFGKVIVKSLFADQFEGVPMTASSRQVTKLEEEKISAFYGGGTLYATEARLNPQL
ncbi:photosynthetic reaction center subunit H [Litorisediminicola beolgyonensis]|uniref:Photosynthetic reaction center subunit H n=1 Tax=Litorisediminicola beolgyonensis TaxID=1173614 RepID=A0ABW3ZG73_9RHOB